MKEEEAEGIDATWATRKRAGHCRTLCVKWWWWWYCYYFGVFFLLKWPVVIAGDDVLFIFTLMVCTLTLLKHCAIIQYLCCDDIDDFIMCIIVLFCLPMMCHSIPTGIDHCDDILYCWYDEPFVSWCCVYMPGIPAMTFCWKPWPDIGTDDSITRHWRRERCYSCCYLLPTYYCWYHCRNVLALYWRQAFLHCESLGRMCINVVLQRRTYVWLQEKEENGWRCGNGNSYVTTIGSLFLFISICVLSCV